MNWDEIVHENASPMFRVARRILGNSTDAEEAVQEAFVKAFQLRQKETVINWAGLLYRMTSNASLDLLRKRRLTVSIDDPQAYAGNSDEPIDQAIALELAELLRQQIAHLPAQQSEVFCMSHFDGKSNTEIADLLGIPLGAVATALHKARKKLARSFFTPAEKSQ